MAELGPKIPAHAIVQLFSSAVNARDGNADTAERHLTNRTGEHPFLAQ